MPSATWIWCGSCRAISHSSGKCAECDKPGVRLTKTKAKELIGEMERERRELARIGRQLEERLVSKATCKKCGGQARDSSRQRFLSSPERGERSPLRVHPGNVGARSVEVKLCKCMDEASQL